MSARDLATPGAGSRVTRGHDVAAIGVERCESGDEALDLIGISITVRPGVTTAGDATRCDGAIIAVAKKSHLVEAVQHDTGG